MSGGIGLSAIFISLASGFNTDLMSYLFGSVSAVSRQDLWVVIGIAIVVFLFLFAFSKKCSFYPLMRNMPMRVAYPQNGFTFYL